MATHTVNPSSSASRWNYDVFLNYEGEETENNFASNLYAYLERAKIKTFKRDENLNREKLSEALKNGIKESRIAIVTFSKNYASSTQCLEELCFIMECRENVGQKVFPVFLMGVDGSDVRRQKGSFEMPFRLHQGCFESDMVEGWRSALRAAGELRGWNLDVPVPDGDEGKLIEKIVEEVKTALIGDGEHPTGVDNTHTEAVTSSGAQLNVLFAGIRGEDFRAEVSAIDKAVRVLCGRGRADELFEFRTPFTSF